MRPPGKVCLRRKRKERLSTTDALRYWQLLRGIDGDLLAVLAQTLKADDAVSLGEQEVNTFIREELLAGKIPYEQKVLDQLAQPYHREAEK